MAGDPRSHTAFGLRIRTSLALPELAAAPPVGDPDLTIEVIPPGGLRARFSGDRHPPERRVHTLGDGRYTVERGRHGDSLVHHEGHATYLLAAGADLLLCEPGGDAMEAADRRFLLDTCLGMAAMGRGFELIHASTFDAGDGVVAVAAGQGGGKSTLVAEMLRRGHDLFSDDLLALAPGPEGRPVAHPGPPVMNVPLAFHGGVGTPIATFGDEVWTAVDRGTTGPRPLAAVVLLDRGDHGAVAAERLPASPAPLLAHSLLSGRQPERLARRFALIADVADSAVLWRLRAPSAAPPSEVADALAAALGC